MKTRDEKSLKQDITTWLKEVIDPELMINIVDLGLVYNVEINTQTKTIIVSHTLTTPGCPMGDVIQRSIEQNLREHLPDFVVIIQLVWTPAWSVDLISEAGHYALNGGQDAF